MPIETICQKCSQKLRVADEHAGKTARCPNCKSTYTVPQATPPSFTFSSPTEQKLSATPELSAPRLQPTDPANEALDAVWRLVLDDGRSFGPVTKLELDRWFTEGRITPRSEICNDREQTRVPANEVYSQVRSPSAIPVPGPANPFRESEFNPYASPAGMSPFGNSPVTWRESHRGATILILGVIGMVFCALVGIPAVMMGHADLAKIRTGSMDPEGKGLVIAGLVCGWISIAQLLFLGCIFSLAALGNLQ